MRSGTQLYADTLDAPTEERDSLGRIVTRTETTPSGTTQWKYLYDTRGRLTIVLRDDELYELLTYDANGNRTRRETLDETIDATYDDQDRLLSYGAYAYTYTANGELRTKTDTSTGAVTTYGYDVRGNLVRVDLPDGTVIEYVVDGLDRRVAKKKNGIVQKRWLYRDQFRIAAELDGDGNLISRFVSASGSSTPDFVVRDGSTYCIGYDHLGTPRVVVNPTDASQVAQLIRHDAWGVVLEDSNPGWMPFGFAGGLYDPDTGLVRFGARDYDPQTGRWTARDPALFAGGQANLYAYSFNDPINFIDVTGRAPTPAEVEAAYAQAYEQWWQNRPSRFRTWGPFSNWSAAAGGDAPVCSDYAEAAADFMNAHVDIPGTGAYSVWNHWQPTGDLGVFDQSADLSLFPHNTVQVYMTGDDGSPVQVSEYDPWRRPW